MIKMIIKKQTSGGSQTFPLQNKLSKDKRKILLGFDGENYVIQEMPL